MVIKVQSNKCATWAAIIFENFVHLSGTMRHDTMFQHTMCVCDIDLKYKLILYTDIRIINSITSEYGFTYSFTTHIALLGVAVLVCRMCNVSAATQNSRFNAVSVSIESVSGR